MYTSQLLACSSTSVRFFCAKQVSRSVNMIDKFKSTPYSFIPLQSKKVALRKMSWKSCHWVLETLGRASHVVWSSVMKTLLDSIRITKNTKKKALKMLFEWKEKYASEATYTALHFALCHEFVKRKGLAEKFCCVENNWDNSPLVEIIGPLKLGKRDQMFTKTIVQRGEWICSLFYVFVCCFGLEGAQNTVVYSILKK